MTTSLNERTHFFIKIYLSHLIRKGWCWLCVRGELETGTDYYILTQSFSENSSTSFAFWLGCLTVGHWGPKALRLPLTLNSASFSRTGSNCNWNCNWSKPSVAPGYIIVWHPHASCERTHQPNSTTSTGQGDIPMSSTGCTCFAVLPLIYTGASLDWRLGRGSICYSNCISFLAWFYGISTIAGYLMPNTVYTYILNVYMIC